jgi:hypothetical protein
VPETNGITIRQTHTVEIDLLLDPMLVSHLDRFPRQPHMAVIALHSKCSIMPVIFFVATDTTGRLGQFGAYRILMAIDTLKVLMFPVKFEAGFIVIKIPVLPVTGVVTNITAFSESTLVHVLLFVARPAIRLGLFEHHSQMAFLALYQYVFPGELEARHPVVELDFFP